jgi:SAM-dependent methyltransferase
MLSMQWAQEPTNASRVHLDAFVAAAARSVPPGALVLDAGAGISPYRHHFDHLRYESSDFGEVDKDYAQDLTYVCDLASVPVDDGRFDLVVLTQVLEHLAEPLTVLEEMHRIVRPGAQIWASCPLYYEEHEQPYDFYRYTQFALRRLFDEAGFADIEIAWLEGYLATVSYQVDLLIRSLPRRANVAKLPLRAVSELCARSDLKRKRTGTGHPKNYTVVARRPLQ